jgi:hypothetical protein
VNEGWRSASFADLSAASRFRETTVLRKPVGESTKPSS